ncbi:hypothetical protein GCM10011386_39160 [Parapedobacter defluvii]|uniref:Rad50/SbcC-type AAA domain-containing protein n=1 Tax=Parapedobacter defluvii TaxID=2045106 RepID=A0ABQ1MQR5_9SPHI|nr:hypothetical protein [Parapedobacter defluvii]GGC43052.1 hypothetical protein GCM10011386_39160 [Parapedobacter defluvii]
MAVDFKILGWSAKGLRCPDHDISFEKGDNRVHKIALIQMPNGTGKTTTLKLLRAALAGPKIWEDNFDKPQQFRKNKQTLHGQFELKLLYAKHKRLTIVLDFDFSNEGAVNYITTGPHGMDSGFNPPVGLTSVLKPDFVNLLMFDGELAANLLNPEHTNAQKAIEEMYQLLFLQRMKDRIDEYWNTLANNAGSKGSQREFTQRRNKVEALKARIDEVKSIKSGEEGQLEDINKEIQRLENEFQQEINKSDTDKKALADAEANLSSTIQLVSEKAKDIALLMKNPAELSASLAQNIVFLKDSLDKVKLPGIAAREFFEEIADEPHCICGREIDPAIQKVIRDGAKKYLGSEEVAVLNAMKSDIKDRIANSNLSAAETKLEQLMQEIDGAQHAEILARQKLDAIKHLAGQNDPQIKQINERIDQLKEQKIKLETKIEKYYDKTDMSDSSWNVDNLNEKLKKANADLAEATGTISQKAKRDVLCRILDNALIYARRALSEDVCADANEKIKVLMPNNDIRIASIDKCLRLVEKEAGSVGETLTVGYAFLSSLLSSATHNLPSVVDSPTGSIDLQIRPEIARLIPKLGDQFIAFTISSERDGFVAPLSQAASESIYFLTLFKKGDKALEASARSVSGYRESEDGIWVSGQTYFSAFHTDRQE